MLRDTSGADGREVDENRRPLVEVVDGAHDECEKGVARGPADEVVEVDAVGDVFGSAPVGSRPTGEPVRRLPHELDLLRARPAGGLRSGDGFDQAPTVDYRAEVAVG